jgi:hypothetical protein
LVLQLLLLLANAQAVFVMLSVLWFSVYVPSTLVCNDLSQLEVILLQDSGVCIVVQVFVLRIQSHLSCFPRQ